MTDTIANFIDHLRQSGIGPENPHDIVDDDKRHRYRLDGDKPKTLNGSYQLRAEADGFAVGWGRSFREGVTYPWHSKSNRKADPAEREKWKAKAKAAKDARDAEQAAAAASAARKAARLWERCAKTGSSPYLERKKVALNGARLMRDMVVVPMRKGPDLVGLQFISPDGSKRFLRDTAKEGSYLSIATKGDDLSHIVICEGFATGGSIRAATGWPVIVAFDAGNMKPVAVAIHKKYPAAEIIMAGDNDQWSRKPDGSDYNAGLIGAQQAAVAIGGARVITPQVPPDDPGGRTDWNDIGVTDGLDAVRDAITAPPPILYHEAHDVPDYEPVGPLLAGDIDPLDVIRPLGHNRGVYYFFPRSAGQIVSLSSTGMGKIQNLYMLAPRDFWTNHYGGDKVADSNICAYASAHLMDACHRCGIFEPESTRGVGAWIDKGRVVINTGAEVITDGATFHPAEFRGEAVYESGPRVIHLDRDPLTNREASKVRDICRSLSWKKTMFGDLLAGWLVVAPIGAALTWRPHIWITGRSGSGKSTVMGDIIGPILGEVAIRRDGGTTEPGVRKALGSSGRPYLLDEAESETQQDRSQMERIIFLARRSSSGGVVENFNSSFQARSCFCFSAINPRVEQNADKGRITQLELMQDVSADKDARFERLMETVHEVITPDFNRRLLARTVKNMAALLENVRTFSAAASVTLGNKRAGDQFGPMIAGAYSLTSTGMISFEDARKWLVAQDWGWSANGDDESDSHKLVTQIMTSRIGYDVAGRRMESTIGEMIARVADHGHAEQEAARTGLKPYGIKLEGDRILIANQSPQLKRILQDTPWSPWNRTLGDYPGSDNFGGKAVYFGPGLTSKCISIPVSAVLAPVVSDWSGVPVEEEFR